MLRVVIVDDEPFIREGLATIIDWNQYGYTICGEAEDGEEGLAKIMELDPDLAIVDIKMPGINGLEMVEKLREANTRCRIIFLTAYSDFQFAQKAIELGTEAYILKPIEQSELIEKITKVKKLLEEEKEVQDHMDLSISLSKDKILENLVRGQIGRDAIEQYSKVFHLDFPWKSYQIALVEKDRKHMEISDRKLKEEIERFVQKNQYGYVFPIGQYIGILFKNIAFTVYPRILAELQAKVMDVLEREIVICLGMVVDHPTEIQKSYERAYQLMDKKFIYGHKKVIMGIMAGDRGAPSKQKAHLDMEVLADTLYSAVEVGNVEYINDLLEEIRNFFTSQESAEDCIKIHYTNLYTIITNRLQSNCEELKEYFQHEEEKKAIDEISRKTSLQELHGYMKYRLFSVSDELENQRPDRPMEKILYFIEHNYSQDIKLEKLSVLFHYNSVYLGKLFKNYTGESFNTYMDQVRIQKAKEFLKQGLKVYQVAERVGYKDIDFFYKKFKKYVGVSPSEFSKKSQ